MSSNNVPPAPDPPHYTFLTPLAEELVKAIREKRRDDHLLNALLYGFLHRAWFDGYYAEELPVAPRKGLPLSLLQDTEKLIEFLNTKTCTYCRVGTPFSVDDPARHVRYCCDGCRSEGGHFYTCTAKGRQIVTELLEKVKDQCHGLW